MGICLFKSKFSLYLIYPGLNKLGCFKRIFFVKDGSFCKLCRSDYATLALYHSDYGSGSDFHSVDETVGFENKLHGFHKLPLFSIVATVVKSLNWRVARTIRFGESVNKYGFPDSINYFRMIVHLFSFAGMQLEVHALLGDILSYYQKVDLDLLELLPTMLESCKDEVTSVFVVDPLIKVFASNSLLEKAVNVFFQAKTIGIMHGIRACNFLLKCLAERNKEENVGINMASYLGTIREEMAKRGISRSVVTHSVYIRGLCRVGCTELALNTIKELRQSNQPINVYCYNAVMHSFCQNGELDRSMRVFVEMKRWGILPDVYSYSILIDGYCKFGNFVKGITLLDEMERDTNFKPSVVTYTSLLNGLCKRGLIEAAVSLFHKLGNWGYKYDQHACIILIGGFLRQDNVDRAYEPPEERIRNNMAYDFSCRGVSSVRYMEGPVMKALGFLEEMQNQGIKPGIFSYSIIIDRLCKEGKPENALEFIPYICLKGMYFPML